jgi:hypothetical protein
LNDFVAGLLRLVVRVVVIAMGLVLFASLLVAVLLLALVWMLRAGWARLTGRPVSPFVMRMDPRKGFSRMYRSGERWSAAPPRDAATSDDGAPLRRGGVLPGAGDVMDVEARDLR